MNIPEKHRSIVRLHSAGEAGLTEKEVPVVNDDEILILVKAVTLNPLVHSFIRCIIIMWRPSGPTGNMSSRGSSQANLPAAISPGMSYLSDHRPIQKACMLAMLSLAILAGVPLMARMAHSKVSPSKTNGDSLKFRSEYIKMYPELVVALFLE
jgi:hypothetical protein